ncbi:MAG: PAS domain S-box protein [Promethearchaeota archaeon]
MNDITEKKFAEQKVAERKEAEKKLKESEKKYRHLFETSPLMIVLLDSNGKILDFNPAGLNLFNFKKEEIIGKNYQELENIPLKNVSIYKEKLNTLFNKGILEPFEIRAMVKGKVLKWMNIQGSLVDIENKKLVQIIFQDINEQRIAEQKLKESEEKYRLIAENANDIIYILNQDYKLEYINENDFMKQLGYTSEELIGKSPLELIHPEDIRRVRKGLIKGFKIGQGMIQVRIKDKKNIYHWFEVRGTTFLDTNGKTKVLSIARNITERKHVEQELRNSLENRKELENIINRSLAVVFLWKNKEGWPVEYVSENIEQFGYTPEEFFSGKLTYSEIIHPDDLERIAAEVNFHSMEGIQEFEQEYRIITKSGAICYINDHTWIRKNQRGEITHYQGIILDITERKSFELELKESEEKFRTLAEQSFLGIAIIQDNLVKYINQKIANLFGYSMDEILNWSAGQFLDVIHPEDREFVTKQVMKKQLGEKNSINQYQFRGIKTNNDIIWLEVFSKTINYQGKTADFITILDITEKKSAEEALKSEKKFSEDVINTTSDTIFLFEPLTGKAIRWNKSFSEVTGYTDEEIFSMKAPHSYYNEEDLVRAAEAINKISEIGEATVELSLITKDGRSVPFEYRARSFQTPDGTELITSFGRDITERKENETKLRESEEKYREAYNRANFYKDLFAHDINNIMQVINSSAELIMYYQDSFEKTKDIRTIAELIKKQIARAKLLVNNVNTLSELEESTKPIKIIDAYELLQNSVNFVRTAYQERAIDISVQSHSDRIFVHANELLEEVFDNILTNAVKYNDKSLIEILIFVSKETKGEQKYFRFEFIDNGIGIQDERKDLIFKRGHRKLKGQKGMGLGLSLVKKILSTLNGEIWVENRINKDYSKGSKFILLIPEAP